jgi:CheY-like chemotaxis protein
MLQVNANFDNNGKPMDALNILLVDDDRILVTTLSHGLRKGLGKAVSVVFCSSAPEALTLLATQAFNLVISDFHMPGMSGLELLKKIKKDHQKTKLVLITAFTTDTLTEETRQLGIGYIAKPFELPLLVQLIQNLMQGKEARDGIENAPHLPITESNPDPSQLLNKTMINQAASN